jgi:hypothetical protein
MRLLISKQIIREQLRDKLGHSAIQNRFISVKSLYMLIVRTPPHPLWLWWQVPLVGITVANQSRFDFGLPEVSTIVGIRKL